MADSIEAPAPTRSATQPAVPKVDYLDEDPVLSGREYAIVSFLSPDKILPKRDLWFFQKFRQAYVIQTRLKCMETFMAFLSQKYGISVNDIMADYGEFSKAHSTKEEVTYSDIDDAWETFMMTQGDALQRQFNEEVDFQTNIRGFKIRDVAESVAEARHKAKRFAEMDNHKFNVSIVATGKWAPWDPNPETVQDIEYANESLNTLMQKYHENQALKDEFWAKEKAERVQKTIEENRKRKQEVELQVARERQASSSLNP